MLEVVNSHDLVIAQLKAFRPGGFSHVTETSGEVKSEIPSTKVRALFVRDSNPRRPWNARPSQQS